MKTDYHARKENKLERYKGLAEKNRKRSDDLCAESSKMAEVIPFGQPILVGHHSEKGDRNYRARIHNKMDQSVKAGKKADYYEARAESLLNNTAISSDDPNAIDKLKEKLADLEALQELYKQINKIVRNKKFSETQKVEELEKIGISNDKALELMQPGFGGIGIPSFSLTNNNAKIRNTAARIKHLESIEAMPETEEIINGVTLKVNVAANRVQLFFPGKPAEKIRTDLKRRGFHWSCREGCWMRQITNSALYDAKNILSGIEPQ